MEFLKSDGFTAGAVAAGVLSILIEAEFEILAKWMTRNRITYRLGFSIINNFFCRTIYWLCSSSLLSGIVLFLQRYYDLLISVNSYLIGALSFAIANWIAQSRFARVGLHSAQPSVQGGTNYESSLNLCREQFCFLGTGASKLSSAKNFETTVNRCNSTGTKFRFLLSRPDNKIINDAERRAGVANTQYAIKIKQSLGKLATLKNKRSAAIEVRFYPADRLNDFQDFRMMFIDEKTLLLSINAYGKGEGEDLPQLVIRRASFSSSERSFFFAYRSYYRRLWDISEPWDFKTFLED